MSVFLDKLLNIAEGYLPETKGGWVADLRTEAAHIPPGFARMHFQWSGLMAALGAVLYISIGPKRVGQALIGTSIFVLCFAVFMFTLNISDPTAKLIVYGVLGLYVTAAALVIMNLRWLKGFTLGSSFSLCGIWMALGSSKIIPADAPLEFIRAFTIEAAVFMAGLFIAASYLDWLEESHHA